MRQLIILASLVLLASCSKQAQDDDSWVQSAVQQRIDKQVSWNQGKQAHLEIQEQIARMLESEVRVDQAVQIALLNNPSLQATFEEIGIAQADLWEAGLFQNPFLDGYVRFPSSQYSMVNASLSLVTSIIDFFLVPLRKQTAKLQFQEANMRVAHAVVHLAADVEQTVYALIAAQTKFQLQSSLMELASIAQGLSEEQLRVGNVNAFVVETKCADATQAMLELEQTALEVIALKEKLCVLLGVAHQEVTLYPHLPPLPEQELELKDLESIALTQRLDITAARTHAEAIASMGAQKKWWTYTDAKLGVSTEKQSEGFWDTGPAFNLFLPFFNHGQAARSRLLAQLRQAEAHLDALEREAKIRVKSACDKVLKARLIVETYAHSVLPLREQIIETAQKQYNVMTDGVYALLRNKQEELISQINYSLALRDYWTQRALLDLILGEKLDVRGEHE